MLFLSGTGNLVKFAEGLLRIEVLNQVLFVFDNDAEGVDAFRKLEKLNLPANMRAMPYLILRNLGSFQLSGLKAQTFLISMDKPPRLSAILTFV